MPRMIRNDNCKSFCVTTRVCQNSRDVLTFMASLEKGEGGLMCIERFRT